MKRAVILGSSRLADLFKDPELSYPIDSDYFTYKGIWEIHTKMIDSPDYIFVYGMNCKCSADKYMIFHDTDYAFHMIRSMLCN